MQRVRCTLGHPDTPVWRTIWRKTGGTPKPHPNWALGLHRRDWRTFGAWHPGSSGLRPSGSPSGRSTARAGAFGKSAPPTATPLADASKALTQTLEHNPSSVVVVPSKNHALNTQMAQVGLTSSDQWQEHFQPRIQKLTEDIALVHVELDKLERKKSTK